MKLSSAPSSDGARATSSLHRPLVVANWKMNGTSRSLAGARRVADALRERKCGARVVICAPATLIDRLAHVLEGSGVEVGGQDVHTEESGAFTGEISASMLLDAGARLVIVGHSERRLAHGETDAVVARKAQVAMDAGLTPIICVGESAEVRGTGAAAEFVGRQTLASTPDRLAAHRPFYMAYEPLWAIGSGCVPTLAEIEQVHTSLRGLLQAKFGPEAAEAAILYGGSVTPDNAGKIVGLAAVGGLLVGRASLDAEAFLSLLATLDQTLKR